MKRNVGGIEQSARVLVGIAALSVGIYFESWWGLVGLIPLATGVFGYCPLWTLFGISTCKPKA